MLGTIHDAVIHPDSFFDTRDSIPRLSSPAVIVSIVTVLNVVAVLPIVAVFLGRTTSPTQSRILIGLVVFAILGAPGSWLLTAAGFQTISYFFEGEGSFWTTVALSGWGFLPQIVGGLVSVVAAYGTLQNATPPPATFQSPQQILTFAQYVLRGPLQRIASIVWVFVFLWSGYIWVFAVKYARNLSNRQATITVAVPVAISISYVVLTLLP